MAGLFRVLRSRSLPVESSCGLRGAAASLAVVSLRQLHACACRGALEKEGLSGSQGPPDSRGHGLDDEFQRLADSYLRGLWNKVQSGLGEVVGACECQMDTAGGRMVISLPDRAQIMIRKDPQRGMLAVKSDLHVSLCPCGSYDSESEVRFRMRDGRFETEGEPLHSYLEYGLAKHLRIHVDLQPEPLAS